jgi:hypothetical protein
MLGPERLQYLQRLVPDFDAPSGGIPVHHVVGEHGLEHLDREQVLV